MKKIAVLIVVLFALACLPLGSMADQNTDQNTIPNYTDEAMSGESPIRDLEKETEGKDLNPVERQIVTTDIIRSNRSTTIPVQVGQ